jgi:hypothetical protein
LVAGQFEIGPLNMSASSGSLANCGPSGRRSSRHWVTGEPNFGEQEPVSDESETKAAHYRLLGYVFCRPQASWFRILNCDA